MRFVPGLTAYDSNTVLKSATRLIKVEGLNYLGPPDPSRGATPPRPHRQVRVWADLAGFLSARATIC